MKRRRGAVVMELALVIPVLALLLLGIVEIGQALNVKVSLTEACRNGCSTGSRPGSTNDKVMNEVRSTLIASGLPANAATVTILVNGVSQDLVSAKSNDQITIVVSIPWNNVSMVGTSRFFPTGSTLSETSTMLKQG